MRFLFLLLFLCLNSYAFLTGASSGSGGAVDSVNGYTGVVVLDQADIGLGNVDNTSDLNKPISTLMQTALDAKMIRSASSSMQAVYVGKHGSDVACPATPCGDGSYDRPYLNIKTAMAAITDASTSKRYTVFVFPGTYTEATDFKIKSWTTVKGFSKELTVLKRSDNSSVVVDCTANASCRFALVNLTFANGLTVDRTGSTTIGMNLDLQEVRVLGTFLWNGLGAGKDFLVVRNSYFDSAVSFNGLSSVFRDSFVYDTYTMGTTGATQPVSGLMSYATFENCYVYDMTLTAATGHSAYYDNMRGSRVENSITVTKTGTGTLTFAYDAISIPQDAGSFTTSGNVVLTRHTRSHAIGFSSTDATDWAGTAPVTVTEAIDRLADLVKTLNGGTAIP